MVPFFRIMVNEHYNLLLHKASSYFLNGDAYNKTQRRRAAMKNKIVHCFHAAILILVALVITLILKETSPKLDFFLIKCQNQTLSIQNGHQLVSPGQHFDANDRKIQEERDLFTPVKHMNKVSKSFIEMDFAN